MSTFLSTPVATKGRAQQPVRFLYFLVFLFTLLLVCSPGVVNSHPFSVSYARYSLDDESLSATYRLPMDDMDLLLQLDRDLDETITPQELAAAESQIFNYISEHVRIDVNQREVTSELIEIGIWSDSDDFPYLETSMVYRAGESVKSLQVTSGLLTDLYPDHRTLAEFDTNAEKFQFVFQHTNTWNWSSEGYSVWGTAFEFVVFGVEHIFTGYDHLLFLLGLLLVSSGLRNLVIIVTSFTIAHSLTLALATLGVVEPPGYIVEAAIALSIIYVGLENLIVKEVRHRWRLTFAFGLVHGFGFAGLLRDLDLESAGLVLSLFTFNLGVEIGQVAIVAMAWPMLNCLFKSPYRKQAVQLLSLIIVLFGTYWFVERVFM